MLVPLLFSDRITAQPAAFNANSWIDVLVSADLEFLAGVRFAPIAADPQGCSARLMHLPWPTRAQAKPK